MALMEKLNITPYVFSFGSPRIHSFLLVINASVVDQIAKAQLPGIENI